MNFDAIIANPMVGFVGTLVGILGIIISVVLYLNTRRFQRPTYYRNSIKWYDGKSVPHDDIKLTFRGKEIPRFSITNLAFWNSGNQTIRKSDFAPASPLRLRIPQNTEVFNIRVTASTATEIGASVDSPTSFVVGASEEIPVNFDYLDSNDGFAIQVIHDAASPDEFEFIGKLPGVQKFQFTSDSEEFLAPYGRIIFSPDTPPFFKWLLMPFIFFSLGTFGVWSLYWAIYKEFHWYQILGGLMSVYLFFPFFLASQRSMPNELLKALTDRSKPSA